MSSEPDHLPTEARRQAKRADSQASANPQLASLCGWIVVIGFYFANLFIVITPVPSFDFPGYRALALLGLFYQAGLLGIWLGAGGSSLWSRWLLFALSYFYFAWRLPESYGDVDWRTICLLGFWQLAVAIVIATLRSVICCVNRTPLVRRFSLHELLSAVTVAGIALAIWAEPLRNFFQLKDSPRELYSGAMVVLLCAGYVVIVALPTLFRKPDSRWRAFHCSLLLLVLVVLFCTMVSLLFSQPAVATRSVDNVGGFFLICVLSCIAATITSLAIFPAEMALQRWGIDLVRPITADDEGEE